MERDLEALTTQPDALTFIADDCARTATDLQANAQRFSPLALARLLTRCETALRQAARRAELDEALMTWGFAWNGTPEKAAAETALGEALHRYLTGQPVASAEPGPTGSSNKTIHVGAVAARQHPPTEEPT
jgi:hypothetical protein